MNDPTETLTTRGRALRENAGVAAFPLGGIGTGNFAIGARGELRDWELFNHPARGNKLPYSFFAIYTQAPGQAADARVLEARLQPPFEASHGYYSGDLAGLPRLDGSTMRGEYPLLELEFHDATLPVAVRLEAFTPLVPLEPLDSAIPAAVLRYIVRNPGASPVEVSIAGSLANAVGHSGKELFFYPELAGEPRNEYRDEGARRGVFMTNPGLEALDLRAGSMALMTGDPRGSAKEAWLDGYWWDGAHDFWDEFSAGGRLNLHSSLEATGGPLSFGSRLRVGSLAITHTLAPGEERAFEFIVSWCFPNRPRGWEGHIINASPNMAEVVRNHYATIYPDAWAAGSDLLKRLKPLEAQTRRFHDLLFGSTLPPAVIEALSANIPTLRSTTCFQIADGTFLAWEGTFDGRGSCEGSCTHVWNYAQTLAYLFPTLERSMRRVEFLLETDEAGAMAFRTNQVFGGPRWSMMPATDGQLGTVVRLYREWLFSGDDAFLRELWPAARRALEFASGYWDADQDGVLDSRQHNTYDIEFYGPNSLSNSIYFAALKAGAAMARRLDEPEAANAFEAAWERGSARMDELLFDGEYYIQKIEDVNAARYQYGTGCLADQVFGQLLAHLVGLGYVLPQAHVKSAIAAVFKHNFRASLREHQNVQRTYALNDEAGLLLCSWPHGGRPRLPFVYCDEVWAGVEYQVAAHLIYEGLTAEGLRLVEATRARYDGQARNPWNEVECGNHYARSMASWALLPALSGFSYDAPRSSLGFAPRLPGPGGVFKTFFSTGGGWGEYAQEGGPDAFTAEVRLEHGRLNLRQLSLPFAPSGRVTLTLDGDPVACTQDTRDGRLTLRFAPLTVRAGRTLRAAGPLRAPLQP